MRRVRLEGRQIGRARLDIDRLQVVLDRHSGMSLTQVARKHSISRASVCRMVKESTANSDPEDSRASDGEDYDDSDAHGSLVLRRSTSTPANELQSPP
jgi:hypothetical protein